MFFLWVVSFRYYSHSNHYSLHSVPQSCFLLFLNHFPPFLKILLPHTENFLLPSIQPATPPPKAPHIVSFLGASNILCSNIYVSENSSRQTFMFQCTHLLPVSGVAFDFIMPLRRTGVSEGMESVKDQQSHPNA